jgi:hypothetical protein
MKVKDLVEQLESYDGEQELIVAYWDKETVERYGSGWGDTSKDLSLTDEDWSLVVERYENGEWHWQGSAGDDFVEIAREVIAEASEG